MRIHLTPTVLHKAWAIAVRLQAKLSRCLRSQPADDGQPATPGSKMVARPDLARTACMPRLAGSMEPARAGARASDGGNDLSHLWRVLPAPSARGYIAARQNASFGSSLRG